MLREADWVTRVGHGPKAELEHLFARFAEPKRLIWIEARNHFFDGGLDELEKAVAALGAIVG